MDSSIAEIISGTMMLIVIFSPTALVFTFGAFFVGKGRRGGYALVSAIFSVAVALVVKSLLQDEFDESINIAINGMVIHFFGLPVLALIWKHIGPIWTRK